MCVYVCILACEQSWILRQNATQSHKQYSWGRDITVKPMFAEPCPLQYCSACLRLWLAPAVSFSVSTSVSFSSLRINLFSHLWPCLMKCHPVCLRLCFISPAVNVSPFVTLCHEVSSRMSSFLLQWTCPRLWPCLMKCHPVCLRLCFISPAMNVSPFVTLSLEMSYSMFPFLFRVSFSEPLSPFVTRMGEVAFCTSPFVFRVTFSKCVSRCDPAWWSFCVSFCVSCLCLFPFVRVSLPNSGHRVCNYLCGILS